MKPPLRIVNSEKSQISVSGNLALHILLIVILAFTISCNKTTDMNDECPVIEPNPCNSNEAIDIAILNGLLSHYQEFVPVAIVQESPELLSVEYYLQANSECIEKPDTSLIEELINANQQTILWCSQQLGGFQIIPNEEINCLYNASQFLNDYTHKFGGGKFLEVSKPVIDKNGRAILILNDSRCSDEIVILEKLSSIWKIVCQMTLSVC